MSHSVNPNSGAVEVSDEGIKSSPFDWLMELDLVTAHVIANDLRCVECDGNGELRVYTITDGRAKGHCPWLESRRGERCKCA